MRCLFNKPANYGRRFKRGIRQTARFYLDEIAGRGPQSSPFWRHCCCRRWSEPSGGRSWRSAKASLRQDLPACFVYANTFNDYFPLCVASGGSGFLHIDLQSFTSFVVRNGKLRAPHPLPNNTPVGQTCRPRSVRLSGVSCMRTRMIGDGRVLSLPGLSRRFALWPRAVFQSVFMSTDSTSAAWFATRCYLTRRSTLVHLPSSPLDGLRLFPQKPAASFPGRLFAMDALQTEIQRNPPPLDSPPFPSSGVTFGPTSFAHYPARGFDVLWTDTSRLNLFKARRRSSWQTAGKVVVIDGNSYYLNDDNRDYAELFSLLENDQ